MVRRHGIGADFAAILEPVPEGTRPVVTEVRPVPGGVEVATDSGRRTVTLPEPE